MYYLPGDPNEPYMIEADSEPELVGRIIPRVMSDIAVKYIQRLAREEEGKGGKSQTGGISEYARTHGYSSHVIVQQWLNAYMVYKTANNVGSLSHRILYEISKTPELAWQAMCEYAEKVRLAG